MISLLRVLLALLSGLVAGLAAWFALAMLVIAITGSGGDGGGAMSAFFQVGPIGGLVGFGAGVWLFLRFGWKRRGATSTIN